MQTLPNIEQVWQRLLEISRRTVTFLCNKRNTTTTKRTRKQISNKSLLSNKVELIRWAKELPTIFGATTSLTFGIKRKIIVIQKISNQIQKVEDNAVLSSFLFLSFFR